MARFTLALAVVWLLTTMPTAAAAGDPPKPDRTLGKQPDYQTKAPRYGLLVFGPEGKDRVWLVQDGDALYVDRNGNGDLTDPGEKVAAEKPKGAYVPDEGEFSFEIGDLTVGGRAHKGVRVSVSRVSRYQHASIANRADIKAALAKDPKATAMSVAGDVEGTGLKGGGIGGRLSFMAGPLDLDGVLQFSDKPAGAPVVHFGGPLEITFYAGRPTPRVGRDSQFVLVVGTPGDGPGTFAMLAYAGTIPEDARPMAEVTYQPVKPGDPPLKEKFEIKERC